MKVQDPYFTYLVEKFVEIPQVEAISLGGSRARGQFDPTSDYDLYIYIKEEIPAARRQEILDQCCCYIELNNQFWETEDDCTLKNGIDIDIIYRNLDEISAQVQAVVQGLAYSGYTTCMWENILTSQTLYDADGRLEQLKAGLDIDYPDLLQENIIRKNMRLLTGNLPSYDRQIKKAVSRRDLPSISHRTAAFLESYFDILFALNKILHPGEKRMMEKLAGAEILPADFEENLNQLFRTQYTDPEAFEKTLDIIIHEAEVLVNKHGFSGSD